MAMQFPPASATTMLRTFLRGGIAHRHRASVSNTAAALPTQQWQRAASMTSTPPQRQKQQQGHGPNASLSHPSPSLLVVPSSSPPRLTNNTLILSANLSTAAAMAQDSTPPTQPSQGETRRTKRKTLRSRDPLIVTPAAAARIQFLISRHNETGGSAEEGPAVGIRLGTKKRGCNGLSYTLNYAYEDHLKKHGRDEAMTIEENGLLVFVEPMALMNVIGTTMDFVDDEMSSEFTFTNPNSKGECGCGESFNV